MRDRTLIGLAATAAFAGLLVVFLPTPDVAPIPPATASGPLLSGLGGWISGASRVLIVASGQGLAFVREPRAPIPGDDVPVTGWKLLAKGGYPVRAAAMRVLLEGLVNLRAARAKTADSGLYARLAVEGPKSGATDASRLIQVADAAGHSASVILGNARTAVIGEDIAETGGDGVYARLPGVAQAWLAHPAFDAPSDALSWLDTTVLDIDASRIASVSITTASNQPIRFQRARPGDAFSVLGLPPDAQLLIPDPGGVIAADFTVLSFVDVGPAARMTTVHRALAHMASFDGLTVDLDLSVDSANNNWLSVRAAGVTKAAGEAAAINARSAGWLYEIPPARAQFFAVKVSDLVQANSKR
jgi:hypothetical protein